MKKIFVLLLIALAASACTFDIKTNAKIVEAIQKKSKAKSVKITDGAEASANFKGSKKDILIDMGDSSSSDKSVMMNVAYHCADTAYRITVANKAKVPDVYRVAVKSGGLTSDFFTFKSAYLSKNDEVWKAVRPLMADIIAKNYDKVPGYLSPFLQPKIQPVIDYLKKADVGGTGLSEYRTWAILHMKDKMPDGKPINLIQTWIAVKINGKIYPMVISFGAEDMAIYGLFINPQKV